MSRGTRTRTLRSLALTATATVALTSCSTHPGSAARVGSTSISESRVDDVAQQLCTARVVTAKAQGQQSPALASRSARQAAVGVLIDASLSRQYGDSVGAEPDPEQLAAAVQGSQATVAAMPARLRAGYTATLEEVVSGQLVLLAAGRKQLASAGSGGTVTDQQAYQEGVKLQQAWQTRHARVSVDPRFGTYRRGTLTPGGGSLSVPVSSGAVAGSAVEPNTSFVGGLPDNQKCG